MAAAFPELYPPTAPSADVYQPPSGAPYPQPSASPWAQPSSQQPATQQPAFQQPATQQPTSHQPTSHQPTSQLPPVSAAWPSQPPYPGPQQAPGYGPPAPGYPPGYPAQYPVAHYPGTGYPGPQATNGKAIAGLVLGIVSLGFFFFTVLDIPLIVLGIVFSVLGGRAARRGEGRRAMALAGLICSVVAAVVVTVALTYVVARGHTCEQRYDRGSTEYNSCLFHLN